MGFMKRSLFFHTSAILCFLQIIVCWAEAKTEVGTYCYFGTCKKVFKIDTLADFDSSEKACIKQKMELYHFWDQEDYDWIITKVKGSKAPAYWTSVCQYPVVAEHSNVTLEKFTRVDYKLEGREVEKGQCINCQPLSEMTVAVNVPGYPIARCILISKAGDPIYRIVYHNNAGALCQQIL